MIRGQAEPGYARIVWTIEATLLSPAASQFRTQTRVSMTDPRSRALVRRYWAALSPGMSLLLGIVCRGQPCGP
jgi:hypothetical protein